MPGAWHCTPACSTALSSVFEQLDVLQIIAAPSLTVRPQNRWFVLTGGSEGEPAQERSRAGSVS